MQPSVVDGRVTATSPLITVTVCARRRDCARAASLPLASLALFDGGCDTAIRPMANAWG